MTITAHQGSVRRSCGARPMHDTYHVGQLGYVRKALGLPGVVG
jgi:hypothetical protein